MPVVDAEGVSKSTSVYCLCLVSDVALGQGLNGIPVEDIRVHGSSPVRVCRTLTSYVGSSTSYYITGYPGCPSVMKRVMALRWCFPLSHQNALTSWEHPVATCQRDTGLPGPSLVQQYQVAFQKPRV